MRKLTGKRVWVIQQTDSDYHIRMWCVGVSDGFIALAEERGGEPVIYVNLQTVDEIEVCQEGEQTAAGRLLTLARPGRRDGEPE